MHKTKIDLPADKRASLIALLNDRLADLIDLQMQAKQAHWNVRGPNFIALHELFDQVATDVLPFIDETAERIATLGGIADGGLPTVAKRSKLPPYPTDAVSGCQHVDALSTALATAGKLVRAAIDEAAALGDADAADLLTGASRAIDLKLWFVEAHHQAEK